LGISNASGVIDQIILGPQDKASNFIEQSFGSWNFSRTFARIDTGLLSTGTKFFVSGSTTDSDKWTGVGDQSRDNAALGWSQTFGNALKIDLDAVYNNYEGTRFRGRTYNDVQHLGKNYDFDYNETLTGDPAKDANYYKFNFVSAETFATQANIDYQFDKGQHIVFKPYYWHNNGAQYSAAGRQVQIWRQQNDNVGGVLEYDGHFDTGTDVVAGYWWQSMEPPPPPTDQRRFSITADGDLVFASWSTIAKIDDFVVNSPYVQATQDIGPVTLTAGLRYMSLGAPEMHYFDSTNVPDGSVDSALAASKGEITGTAVSAHDYNEYLPNVGITTDLGYGWTTNLSYGRNFGRPDWGPQASNYISNRATFQAKGFTLQDLIDNVRPEIADQVSAQATYRGYGFTVAPAVFYAEHDNKQVKVVDPDLSKFAGKDIAYYQGTGSSTEYGAELQVAYQFGSELFVFGSGTLASETFDSDTPTLGGGRLLATKGKQIPNTPQTMLKAGFTYSWNGFALTPVVRYIGERYGDAANMEKVSGFTLVDLTASYGIENMLGVDEATLRFGVMNLFDRKYVAEISPSDTDLSSGATYYVGAPRTFVGTVAVKF